MMTGIERHWAEEEAASSGVDIPMDSKILTHMLLDAGPAVEEMLRLKHIVLKAAAKRTKARRKT